MIGAWWTGVAGLASQTTARDNESNNEANVNTVGDNKFAATKSSGTAYNADGMNAIKEKSLERSNVSYSASLTSLMVYQRAYEASSKSITTSDDFLKTAIDMVK